MTTVDVLGLVILGMAAAVGFAALAGSLLAFGEEREEGLEIEAEGLMR